MRRARVLPTVGVIERLVLSEGVGDAEEDSIDFAPAGETDDEGSREVIASDEKRTDSRGSRLRVAEFENVLRIVGLKGAGIDGRPRVGRDAG